MNSQSNAGSPQSGFAPNDSRVNLVGQVIFGVASKSKARTIREFDHKNHYKDWLFFYDPTRDRGMEIKGPTSLSPVALLPSGAGTSNPAQPPNQGQPPQTQPPQAQQEQ
ncbi:MAG TPA: hypothetical protein VGM18_09645 [Candidatus Sulfotelmatobacter sp.]